MRNEEVPYQQKIPQLKSAALTIAPSVAPVPRIMHTFVVLAQARRLSLYHLSKSRRGWDRVRLVQSTLHVYLGRLDEAVFVPLRALARLPRLRAEVAKLMPTPAGHMIASEGKFDELVAGRAAFPALAVAECEDLGVLRRCARKRVVALLLAGQAGNREAIRATN